MLWSLASFIIGVFIGRRLSSGPRRSGRESSDVPSRDSPNPFARQSRVAPQSVQAPADPYCPTSGGVDIPSLPPTTTSDDPTARVGLPPPAAPASLSPSLPASEASTPTTLEDASIARRYAGAS